MKFFGSESNHTKKALLTLAGVATTLVCVLTFSTCVAVAHAQTTGTASTSSPTSSGNNLFQTAGSVVSSLSNITGNPAGQLLGGSLSALGNTNISPSTVATGILGDTVAAVAQFVFYIAGFLFGIVGMMFNWVIVLTVFQFGAYFGNSAGMLIAWGVLRDIGNILLLFGFIFMGVLMILDLHNGIDTKKAIPGLIIFAVLLNFSLFASEAIVDVSNVLSAAIFNQAGQCTSVTCINATNTSTTQTIGGTTATNTGISGVIISTLGLSTLFDPNTNTTKALTGNPVNNALFSVGAAIFLLVAMVVLLAGTIMLLIRAVTLAFLLVVSPIGFAAMAIPFLRSTADRWWKALLSQSFFAPVFLLLILVSIKIVTGIGSIEVGSNSLADAIASPSSSNLGIILIFVLMIGFMLAALTVAKSLGAIGADVASNIAKKTVTGTMLAPARLAANVGGAGINRVSGGAARRLSEGYNTMIGNAVHRGGIAGTLAKSLDYAAGESITGTLGKVQKAKVGGARSFEEQKANEKHRDHETHVAQEKAAREKTIATGLAAAAGTPAAEAMERVLQQTPASDIAETVGKAKGPDREKLAKTLSATKFKEVYENKDLSTAAKDDLFKGRYGAAATAAETYATGMAAYDDAVSRGVPPPPHPDFTLAQDALKGLSADEIKFIGQNKPDVLKNMLKVVNNPTLPGGTGKTGLKAAIIDGVAENDFYTANERAAANSAKPAEQLKKFVKLAVPAGSPAAANRAQAIQNLMSNIGKGFGKVSKDVVLDKDVAPHITQQHLQALVSENNIETLADRKKIIQNMIDHYGMMGPRTREYINIQTYLNKNTTAKAFFGGINLP